MDITIDNVTRNEIDGENCFGYSLTIGDIKIDDLLEWDSVLFGECDDTWYDVQGRQKIIAALGERYSDDVIFGATVDLFDTISRALKSTLSGARIWISTAKDLDHLLAILQQLRVDMTPEDLSNLDLSSLPTFGGSSPDDTSGIWSWDEDRILVGGCIADMTIMNR